MSWLIQHAKKNEILPRKQELPEEAFMSVQELKDIYGDGNKDGVLPIVVISFCWDTASHPDPSGKQLKTVAAKMEEERAKYEKLFSDMGVFWDWLSINQKDPRLFDKSETPEAKPEADRATFERDLKEKRKFYGGQQYEQSRTPEEKKSFDYALHETMDLWYAHQGTTVYMLTKLPEGSTRTNGYFNSGWTTYERCSAEQIKKVYLFEAKWKLVLDLGAENAEKARNWPIGPEDFDQMIGQKHFTNGADTKVVKELFRKMSNAQLGSIKVLDFTGIAAPTTQDARRLGGCLNLCKNLETLDLTSVAFGDDACKEAFSMLSKGALAALETLDLRGNAIGDDGMSALAKAIKPTAENASGALDNLKVSWRSIALFPCLDTLHVHSPDSEHLFDVPYAGTSPWQQQDF